MEPQQEIGEGINDLISKIRTISKADPLFKDMKKVKQAIDTILKTEEQQSIDNLVSPTLTPYLIIFYFGAGQLKEYQSLKKLFPQEARVQLAAGLPYGHIDFTSVELCKQFLQAHAKVQQSQLRKLGNSAWTIHPPTDVHKIFVLLQTHIPSSKLKGLSSKNSIIPDCTSTYQEAIPGLKIIYDFVSPAEEQQLVKDIDSRKWIRLSNRKVQHYGFEFKYGVNSVNKMQNCEEYSPVIQRLAQKLSKLPFCQGTMFDQLTINCYEPGDGIPSHFDTHSPFQEVFVSLTLLGSVVMEWKSYRKEQQTTLLTGRSLVVFQGEARYAWQHSITPRINDRVDGQIVYRTRRLSLTFRKIKHTPCTCPYYFYCDSQGYDQYTMKKSNPLLKKYLANETTLAVGNTPQEVRKIQQTYVHEAYNGFGYTFSNPIHPKVMDWIHQIPKQSYVLDVGCGNGYYLGFLEKQGALGFGVERCTVMESHTGVKDERVYADAMALPYRPAVFDAVLLVAVWHHLASEEHRVVALQEIARVLRVGGECLISVWSWEAHSDIYQESQDIFMDFTLPAHRKKVVGQQAATKKEVFKRYYHLFKLKEIEELVARFKGLKLKQILTQFNNYYIYLVKQ